MFARSRVDRRAAICDGIDLWLSRGIKCGLLPLPINLFTMNANAEVQEFC